MKSPSPLLGFNNNVRHKGRVFHIQTEDSGVKHPHVITHLFADGGRIVRSTKTSYAEYVGDEEMPRKVRALMQEQHKAMFIALRACKFDHLLEGIPLAEPQAGHRPPMESTLSIEVEGEKAAIPGAPQSNPGASIPQAASSSPGQAAPPPTPSTTGAAPPVVPAKAVAPQAASENQKEPVAELAPEAPSAPPTSQASPPRSGPAVEASAAASAAASAPASAPASAAASIRAKSPSIPPRNSDPSAGLRRLTPPPKAMPSVPPPRPAPQSSVASRPSVPPPLSMGPAGPATTREAHPPISFDPEPALRTSAPAPMSGVPPIRGNTPRSDPRAEPQGLRAPAQPPSPPQRSPVPPAAGSRPRVDTRAEPAPARRSGSLLATLGSGVPSAPKPPSLGAAPAVRSTLQSSGPASAPSPLSASLGAGLKPRADPVRELGNATTQAMPAPTGLAPAGARAEAAKPPLPRGTSNNSPSRPPMSSSLDLDLEALERAAEQGHSPVYRQVHDLPPPPAAVLRPRGSPASYRSLTPPVSGAQPGPATGPASQATGAAGRYAPSRPASIFGNARPEGSSIFGEDLISEKSLDEVILSYLAEDLDAPRKK